MGRFISPDWSAQVEPVPYAKLGDPQSLNLYSYVENNPLRAADPDGHDCFATYGYGGIGCNAPSPEEENQSSWQQFFNTHPWLDNNLCQCFAGASAQQQKKSSLWQRFLASHPAIAGFLTRYMGSKEAETALRTGKIPNTNDRAVPRPTHFTKDEPTNNAQEAQQKYELRDTPTYRATVPEERAPNVRTPETGATTSGGGSQVVTDDEVPVNPEEIFLLGGGAAGDIPTGDIPIVDPF